jgi:hypothetical protein
MDDGQHLLGRGDVETLVAAIGLGLGDAEQVRHLRVELVRLLRRVAVAAAHGGGSY